MAGKGKGLAIGKKTDIVEKPVNGNDGDNVIDQSASGAANRINGGSGNDAIVGSALADRVNAGDGDDTVMGGAGDDVLFGNDGDDTAAYEGSIFNFTWEAGKGGTLVVTDSTDAEGTDTLKHFENLQFGDYTLDLDGDNAAMILGDDTLNTDEDNAGSASITAWDFDGGTPSVSSISVTGGGSVTAGTSSAGTSGMGTGTNVAIAFDPGAAYQHLAVGESATETITVVMNDGQGNLTSHSIAVTIDGVNDDPTASAIVAANTNEDAGTVGMDLLSTANDIDASDDLDVASVGVTSSDGRSVSYAVDAETGAFSFDAGQFNDLAAGESATVTVAYDVVDGNGGSVANTAEITVDGVNDAPTATGGSGSVTEDGTLSAGGTIGVSDPDTSDDHSFSIQGGGAGTYGTMSVDANGNWTYNLNNSAANVQALNSGDAVVDSFVFNVDDGNGGVTTANVDVTVNGEDDGPVFPTPPDPDGVTILTNVEVLGSWGASSGWQSKAFTIDEAGTYKIAFGAANWYDSILDANLWVDNLQVGGEYFDFETGLAGWSTTGGVSTTTATQTEGLRSVQLHTGNSTEGQIEALIGADVQNETSYGSAMVHTVDLEVGDVVSFDWRFDVSDYMPFNDYAFYMIEMI